MNFMYLCTTAYAQASALRSQLCASLKISVRRMDVDVDSAMLLTTYGTVSNLLLDYTQVNQSALNSCFTVWFYITSRGLDSSLFRSGGRSSNQLL